MFSLESKRFEETISVGHIYLDNGLCAVNTVKSSINKFSAALVAPSESKVTLRLGLNVVDVFSVKSQVLYNETNFYQGHFM